MPGGGEGGQGSRGFERKLRVQGGQAGQEPQREPHPLSGADDSHGTAKIISDKSSSDEVGLNDTVEVYIPEDDETERYKIVTTVRGNSLKGLISIDSPLGKALLGHKVGETVYVKVDERFGYEVEIRSIDTTTEGEEETLRSF